MHPLALVALGRDSVEGIPSVSASCRQVRVKCRLVACGSTRLSYTPSLWVKWHWAHSPFTHLLARTLASAWYRPQMGSISEAWHRTVLRTCEHDSHTVGVKTNIRDSLRLENQLSLLCFCLGKTGDSRSEGHKSSKLLEFNKVSI